MAKVIWNPAIQCVRGSLEKAKKNGHGAYLLGKHYKATASDGVYTHSGRYERSTQPSSDELKARERFAAVANAVRLRKGNLSQITSDQEAFIAQKNTAGGKKTMRAYLWKVCGEEYDAAQNG